MWAMVTGIDSTEAHRRQGDRLAGFAFTTTIGGIGYRGRVNVTDARPGETMALAVETKEVSGEITVGLMPDDNGTIVEVAMVMRPAGIVGSLIFPALRSAVSHGFADSVERLAAALSEG